MAVDDKVVIGQTHAADDAEAVLIGYLLGVEALRAGKQALMWLTKDGVQLATKGYSDDIVVPGAPSIKDLHAEYIDKGGRFFACSIADSCRRQRGGPRIGDAIGIEASAKAYVDGLNKLARLPTATA